MRGISDSILLAAGRKAAAVMMTDFTFVCARVLLVMGGIGWEGMKGTDRTVG